MQHCWHLSAIDVIDISTSHAPRRLVNPSARTCNPCHDAQAMIICSGDRNLLDDLWPVLIEKIPQVRL